MRNPTNRWLLIACALAAMIPFAMPAPAPVVITDFPGWPSEFEGRSLRALPLSALEQRFATDFPGRIGRFTDGEREIILRWISAPSRKLHPAADCLTASGYTVTPLPIDRIAGVVWSTIAANRGDEHLRVREAIVDAAGNRWTDVSAWYWAAVREQTPRPWLAITVATSSSNGGASLPISKRNSPST